MTHTHPVKKIGQTHNHKISNLSYENELFLLIHIKFLDNSTEILFKSKKIFQLIWEKKVHQKMRWQINKENKKRY